MFLILGWKSWRILNLTRAVKADVAQLQEIFDSELSLDSIDRVDLLLVTTRDDVLMLHKETAPFLWITPLFGWLPVYGGDIRYARDLMILSEGLVNAGDAVFQAALPLWHISETQVSSPLQNSKSIQSASTEQPGGFPDRA